MKRFFFVSVFCAISCFAASAQEPAEKPSQPTPPLLKHNMTKAVLLDKIEKAMDPDEKAKSWKTAIAEIQMNVPMQQLKISLTSLDKYPDKSKVTINMPGIPKVTEVFNGKRAWKETEGLGIEEKSGIQLEFAKFECKKSNPALKMSEVYAKITLDPYLYKIGNFTCYKLDCELPPELKVAPSQIFVDNKEFLTRCMIESQLSDMGVVPVRMDFSAFKSFAGVKMPTKIQSNTMGIAVTLTILSFKVNEVIADSEFEFPKSN